jgi:NAD(P)-dependent dehydrogenase (short-subunit alcohol dehydrogenase family)
MALRNLYPSLAGKVVLITGGATGIGASLVEAFSRQRAVVAFVDILENDARELVARLQNDAAATPPHFFACDLRDIDALKSVIAEVRSTLGPVAVLVNNAANDARHDFRELTPDAWNDRINVNLRHVFFATQAVFEHMRELGGGSVVNFGSMSWYECQGGMTGYTTSKAGIEGMTRGLARDLGEHDIRINTIVPGWVMTPRQLRDWVDERTAQEINRSQCLKRPLEPDDIAAMVLFLASDDARMCTAQSFIVDGGWI